MTKPSKAILLGLFYMLFIVVLMLKKLAQKYNLLCGVAVIFIRRM